MNIPSEVTTNFLTGKREIDVLNPSSFMPDLDEVFEALPKINRYNGHTIRPFSVAAHSIACCHVANTRLGLDQPQYLIAVLLHDAAEAYIGDIVRPVKKGLPHTLGAIEAAILSNIFALLDFPDKYHKHVTKDKAFLEYIGLLDVRMALTEMSQLMPSYREGMIEGMEPFEGYSVPDFPSWNLERHCMQRTFELLVNGKIPDWDDCPFIHY